MYVIVVCNGCNRLIVADASTKSRICAYCGQRVNLTKARRVGNAETAIEAMELIQALKKRIS